MFRSPIKRTMTLLAALLFGATALFASPVAAQGTETDQTPLEIDSGGSLSIIPTPEASGSHEVLDGQPGSSQQYMVFVVIIGGLAAIVLLVSRESKKKRAALGITNRDPATLYEDA